MRVALWTAAGKRQEEMQWDRTMRNLGSVSESDNLFKKV